MILIDGSNAGGQLLRTAIALSALTQKPFKISNIRGARPEPGIKAQHLEGIKAIAELCKAKVTGLEIGSKELEFYPQTLEEKDLEINISTAGSVGLVLQSLLILTPHIKKDIKVRFEGGGTWGKWAPPLVYLERVLFPLLDYSCELETIREGFYPKGGAIIEAILKPMRVRKLNLTKKTSLKSSNIVSIASTSLQKSKVAERQADSAVKFLEEKLSTTPFVEIKYSNTLSTGSGIICIIRSESSIVGEDCIGEIGRTAESIGERAARDIIKDYFNGVVDQHASDMLLPYLAFAKSGEILASKITNHVLTSKEIIEKFLDVKFEISGEKGKPGIISVK